MKCKLKFVDHGDRWGYIVESMDGSILHESSAVLFPEDRNEQYFDGWEKQIKMFPIWEIVEVERFI